MASFTKSVLSLLLLTAASTASPIVARAPIFTLTDIVFQQNSTYSAPPHISAYSNSISFTLTNPALPRVSKCHVIVTGEPADIIFDGTVRYVCDGGVSAFTFDDRTGVIGAYDDSEAEGSATSDFTYTSTQTINPDWTTTNGEIYELAVVTGTQAELDITS